ncbi:MAG: NAD(P)H-dependent glycerol-3-phosphate dehydrogenase [Dehalococcoidia bacterium]
MTRVGIIGTGAWATTLGILLTRQGHDATLWARNSEVAQRLSADRSNERFLPGVPFPDQLSVTDSIEGALSGTEIAVIAVPSVTMRDNASLISSYLSENSAIVCATKGIEISSGKRMTEVIREEVRAVPPSRIGALSGPNLAPEIASGKVSTATSAFEDESVGVSVQELFSSEVFRVYRSEDVTGVELGGALKNIIAIGAGFIDGADLGNNAKAAYITRGLHEITRLGVAMGARPDTFAGLSGMGDLIATCISPLSRNYRLGVGLASGKDLESVLGELGQTAEGVPTTQAAVQIAKGLDIDMPITTATYQVLFEGMEPVQAIRELMVRSLQPEVRY